jgi:hypothetical protein
MAACIQHGDFNTTNKGAALIAHNMRAAETQTETAQRSGTLLIRISLRKPLLKKTLRGTLV